MRTAFTERTGRIEELDRSFDGSGSQSNGMVLYRSSTAQKGLTSCLRIKQFAAIVELRPSFSMERHQTASKNTNVTHVAVKVANIPHHARIPKNAVKRFFVHIKNEAAYVVSSARLVWHEQRSLIGLKKAAQLSDITTTLCEPIEPRTVDEPFDWLPLPGG